MRAVISKLTVLAVAAVGCAPRSLPGAMDHYVALERVRDAGVRRARAAWYLRFDAGLLHELDAALASDESPSARRHAERTLQAANNLALRSIRGEILRLSTESREQLARRAGCSSSPNALADEIENRARRALDAEIDRLANAADEAWRARLRDIRRSVEPLPDERDRTLRRVLLAGFAPAAAAGIQQIEQDLRRRTQDTRTGTVESAAVWTPLTDDNDDRLARWAPVLAVTWPEHRDYPAAYDRIGMPELSGDADDIQVSIRTDHPVMYAYESNAVIGKRRYPQVTYVWWFSDRPPMTPHDPAAGHIDGGTLRLTLDRMRRPAVAEIALNCGCGHVVYVADDIEAAARREFGSPVQNAQFAIESRAPGRRPVLVAGLFDRSDAPARPLLVLQAGTHEPLRFTLATDPRSSISRIAEEHAYVLDDYEALDHLPFAGGYASMFGPDGLVHNAGRPEGYLLAPTGMLSAGQPRKRGTQRVRWDEYLFDDPTLLSQTLRIPSAFHRGASQPVHQ